MTLMIRKRDSQAILQSLVSGVVPRRGLEHILVGRAAETRQVLRELNAVEEGAAIVKFISGPFGSGKSFFLSLVRHIALAKRFVVCDVDFSPERRLYGNGYGVSTYATLMNTLSTQSRPDGQALQAIIERWIQQIEAHVADEIGGQARPGSPDFVEAVGQKVRETLLLMEDLTGGFDFAEVLNAYDRGYIDDNQNLSRAALRWLRGEYSTRTEARNDLGVRTIISDANWYDYLKVISRFVRAIGYAGLIVLFDEAINLYKITHAQNRAKNYEVVLQMFNDAHQGRTEGMYVLFGAVPEFITDERRGLFSYEALKSRLQTNPYETDEYRDLSQPVMQLAPLRPEELLVLLQKLRDIHAIHYDYAPTVLDEELEAFLRQMFSRPGADRFLTVRDVVKALLYALNILEQNPERSKSEIFQLASRKADDDSRLTLLGLDSHVQPVPTDEGSDSRFHVKGGESPG